MTARWRTMDAFVPPSPRPFNAAHDHRQWFWISWGGEPHLCRWERPGMFVAVAGGMNLGGEPKYWMPLEVPVFPSTSPEVIGAERVDA